jgi:hypothetical protein
MNETQKAELKARTNAIRVQLDTTSTELTSLVDDPTDLIRRLKECITVNNDQITALNSMDEYIDAQ